ncbi:MAG: fibronectin type III domain-containing protein [candidate division Zixibacteria bacterium]|nr:fibronectin type III domain-containing protein [candidate division Zixibacteria bacterium]
MFLSTPFKSIICIGFSLLLVSCGGRKGSKDSASEQSSNETSEIRELTIEPDNKTITLTWKTSGKKQISSYNIYINREPKLVHKETGLPLVDPFNSEPFLGDTNPDDSVTTFVAKGLRNGVKYYVSVRAAYSNQSLSEPTDELIAVCAPRGKIVLSLRSQSDKDGYSLINDQYVSAHDTANDLYFFSKDTIDYLCSPARFDGFLKENTLILLPFAGTHDEIISKSPLFKNYIAGDRVTIRTGDWVLLRMPDATHALIRVLGIKGKGTDKRVQLSFVYSPLPDEYFF